MDFAPTLAVLMRRLPAFTALGWAMLLVVLLSAAPSGAEPRTRLIGSAFDPASISVALNRKQADDKGGIASFQDDGQPGDAPGAPPVLVQRTRTIAISGIRADRAAPLPEAPGFAIRLYPSGQPHGPRAPPAG